MNQKSRWIVPAIALVAVACSPNDLEEFRLEGTSPSVVSFDGTPLGIKKEGEHILVPLQIQTSNPAGKSFQVELQLIPDTVEQLIASGSLQNTVGIPVNQITAPSVVVVPFGADSSTFTISINLGFAERNFGKNMAFAYRLLNASKGNELDPSGSSGVVILNTVDILDPSDIRYLSITNGGGEILDVRNRQNYQVRSGGLNVPLGISLAGVPGHAFTVEAKVNPDTIAALVANGTLPDNTVALDISQVTMDTVRRIGSNTSSAPLDVFVQWSVIEEHMDDLLAIAVTLGNPSTHVLDESKKSVIILIHPQHVLEVDITNEGTYSVSRDNGGGPEGGEGSLKLIDNDTGTKFLVGDFRRDLWAQLVYDEPTKVGAYTLTSANDAADRDPKNWQLLGSNDGENWVAVDTREDEIFTNRFQTKRYEFEPPEAYTHYRIDFGENNGGSLFQLAEWRIIRIP